MSVCSDSWTVLAWLDGLQPACRRVEKALDDRPVISWITAAEVSYRVERDHGPSEADEVIARLRETLEFELPGVVRMQHVARIKAAMPIALAGCFAIATAAARGLPSLTGDPEIPARDDLPCRVEDLRP